MSKGAPATTVSESKSEPWLEAQPYLKRSYSEAEKLFDAPDPSYYSGTSQAGFTADQLASQAGVRDFASASKGSVVNPALAAYQYGTGSSVLDVANNPYVKSMASQAALDAYAGLAPELAGIRGGAIQSGGYGGGRQGIAEGAALTGAVDAANRASAGIYSQAYGQGLGHQAQTLGQTGNILSAGFKPYSALNLSGLEQQAAAQAVLEDAKAKHAFEQGIPYEKLTGLVGALSGTSGLMGQSSFSQSTGAKQGTIGQLGELAKIGAAAYAPAGGGGFLR